MNAITRCACAAALVCTFTTRPLRAAPETNQPGLSLADAIKWVIKDNPELKASALNVQAADALHQYAGQLDNPEVTVELEDFLGSGPMAGFSGVQTTLALSQRFALGGKRSAKSSIAGASLSLAQAQSKRRRLDILAETITRFLHVVADQHRLDVANRAKRLAQDGLTFATRRVRSGGAHLVEQRRADIAVARSHIRQEHAEHELAASRRRLSMMWGEAEAHFASAKADLFASYDLPTYAVLAAQIDRSPELVQLAEQVAVQKAKIALAEARAVPDLSVSIGGRRAERANAFGMVFGVSIPIPLFERNQGAAGAAAFKRGEIGAEQQARRVRLLAALYGYIQELTHANEELRVLQGDILPNAEGVLELITNGFKAGRFSQIELLDAQRTLVELERERIDAAEEKWIQAIRISSIIGATPQHFVQTETTTTTAPVKRDAHHD